jgi:hypothetical protein
MVDISESSCGAWLELSVHAFCIGMMVYIKALLSLQVACTYDSHLRRSVRAPLPSLNLKNLLMQHADRNVGSQPLVCLKFGLWRVPTGMGVTRLVT